MNIRPFGWRDFPLLNQYRYRGLFLDSTRVLIHGPILIPMGALLSFLGPATRNYTYKSENAAHSGSPIIAQATFVSGSTFARLSFLAPENEMELADLSAISDYLAEQMGKQGAFHLLADVDESNHVFRLLHQAGFAIYARQRIWQLEGQPLGEVDHVTWRECRSSDAVSIRSLYCNVVPGLVQQVEPLPKKHVRGVVHYHEGDLRAFVELKYGRKGIWVQPFVHPDIQGFDRHLVQLLHDLPKRGQRPLYICVRSYQSWLESAIEGLGAKPGPLQAVMVRHLTVAQRVKQAQPLPALNGTRAEPTAPIVRVDEAPLLELSEAKQQPGSSSTQS